MTASFEVVLRDVYLLMPSQGPLEFFVHHNTFHRFESMPFRDALIKGRQLYGGQVLKESEYYQQEFLKGKVSKKALEDQIQEFLKRHELNDSEYQRFCYEILTTRLSKKTLSLLEEDQFLALSKKSYEKSLFFKTLLYKTYQIDIDEAISGPLYQYFASYFDQGSAYWKMLDRENGLLDSFRYYFGRSHFTALPWEKELSQLISKTQDLSSIDLIKYALFKLEIQPSEYKNYLFDLAYRYKGWGALIISFDKHPEWNKKRDILPNFNDFLAILILCESAFLSHLEQEKFEELKKHVPLKEHSPLFSHSFLCSAYSVIKNKFPHLNHADLLNIISHMNDFERQWLWHQAYEETFYEEFLSSFSLLQKKNKKSVKKPKLQVLCCIDDREESFRRYIENQGEDIETFGVAGHFGLDIRYKGVLQAHYRSLCPDIIKPTKKVTEKLNKGEEARKLYRLWGAYLWLQSLSSKTLIRGFIFQFLTGAVAIFSLTIDILSPKLATHLRGFFKKHLDKKLKTHLEYEDIENGGLSLDDQITYGGGVLKTIGLTENFASVIVILGHGSHSLNNPHEAAHDCGACGGGRGAPNARLICDILNKKSVRDGLLTQGIKIPSHTHFVGGYHNTCSDEVLFFDVPQRNDVHQSIEVIRKAAKEDALERCRRYEDVSLSIDVKGAYDHCVSRANNYMQPRPEYGHATNALCIVGPRSFSRNFFLDRRAFLTSYDPEKDTEEATILKNILSAVGPVCSGINLEYYFSFMDNEVYGCGTKLPHNVTSLVGVMNGFQSDLLLGLPWQMVEIHDPYRLMLLVVAETKKLKNLLQEIESFNLLVNNGWIHLSAFDPLDKNLYRYKNGDFVRLNDSGKAEIIYPDNYKAFYNSREACRLGIVEG